MSLRIDLSSFLNTLRRTHGNMTVAVLSEQDARFIQANPGIRPNQLLLTELSDGRAAVSTLGDPGRIEQYLRGQRVGAESWVNLREYDDRYEEAVYVGDIDGRYVRVQTGMLDELFSYVAVQAARLDDTADATEGAQLPEVTGFHEKYERLAAAPVKAQ